MISDDGRELRLSPRIARIPPVGRVHPDTLTKLGVYVIDLSQVKGRSSIHHSKFAVSPEIVHLLGNCVLEGDSFDLDSGPGVGESFIVGAGGAIVAVDEGF